MNEHIGLCSQWKSRYLETLMQLDATIDDVTATATRYIIYLLGSRSDVIDCGVASCI